MKYAFFSDIHGNLDALNAAIKESKELGINKFVILGDYVGYYQKPYEVIKTLLELDCIMIRGNHEELLFRARKDKLFLKELTLRYGHGHEIALSELPNRFFKFLENLPSKRVIELPNNELMLICHGSPWKIDEYIYPDTPKVKINKALMGFDIVACGHSHYQFISRTRKNKFLFNPGSIGQSRSKKSVGACWASFNTQNKEIKFFDTKYDKTNVIEESKILDPNIPYLYNVLKE